MAARTAALLRTAFLLTGDTEGARDLVQTALERVARRLGQIRDEGALEAYVRATIASTAVNGRRRMWSREYATDHLPELAVEDAARGSDVRLTVLAALRALPPAQRAVIVLRFYDDLTEEQTAHALSVPVGTVKSRTARALVSLRASDLALEWSGM